jgi:hypothetical protein
MQQMNALKSRAIGHRPAGMPGWSRTIVADDPRPGLGVLLQGPLQDRFHVGFLHLGPDFPVHDVAAEAIQHGAQEVERAAQIDVGNIDMPMVVGGQRLHEPGAFLGRRVMAPIQPSGPFLHAVHAAGTDGHDIVVEHHEHEPAIALQRMAIVVVEDG